MKAEAFWEEMGLAQDAPIDQVEQRFLEVVKSRIQAVAESFDEKEVAAEEKWLQAFHARFFDHMLRWIKHSTAGLKIKNHPDALKLKIEAKKTVQDLQKNIIAFAICYMHLNRFLTLLRDEIKNEEMKAGLNSGMKYTSDTGVAIRRYQKRKKELLEDLGRYKSMAPILEAINQAVNHIAGAAEDLQGKEKAEALRRSLIAALRTENYSRARKVIKDGSTAKKRFGLDQKTAEKLQNTIEKAGTQIIATIEEHADILKGADEKLYLRPVEISLARDAGKSELRKIRGYLAKYHLPYMQHKVDSLYHLKDKLLVVGSLESLMTLYKQLITGIITPMGEIKEVKYFESHVLGKVKYLLETQFKEIPRINARARETVQEFRKGQATFEDIRNMALDDQPQADEASSEDASESDESSTAEKRSAEAQ